MSANELRRIIEGLQMEDRIYVTFKDNERTVTKWAIFYKNNMNKNFSIAVWMPSGATEILKEISIIDILSIDRV